MNIKRCIVFILNATLLTVILFFVHTLFFVTPAVRHIHAATFHEDVDSCDKITIDTSEIPTCPNVGGYNKDATSYAWKITIHNYIGGITSYIDYTYTTNFCTWGTGKNPCDDNKARVTVTKQPLQSSYDGSWTFVVTLPRRTPNNGMSACGTYQDDFWITKIYNQYYTYLDAQGKPCHYGNPNGRTAPGAAGWCQTGVNCASPIPTPACNTVLKGSLVDTATQATVPITTNNANYPGYQTTLASGNRYWIGGVCPENKTLTITAPAGYVMAPGSGYTVKNSTTATKQVKTDGTNDSIQNFNVQKPCTGTISGRVFEDNDTSFRTAGITNGDTFVPAQTVMVTDGAGNTLSSNPSDGSGNYTVNNVCPGMATISHAISGPASKDIYEYPTSGQPYMITAGNQTACLTDVNNIPYLGMRPTCSGGNITNLNFALQTPNTTPWFRSTCGSMRIDSSPADAVPAPMYALDDFGSTMQCIGQPGIAHSVSSIWNIPNAREVSKMNWQVAKPYSPITVKLAYDYLTTAAQQDNVTITPLQCSPSCDLSTLPHGLYKISGSATFTKANITTGNVIVLVKGAVTISDDITVDKTSTLTIASSGPISVAPTVSRMDGIFSAGTDITVLSYNTFCADSTLGVNGTMIANGSRNGGTFMNKRQVCGVGSNPGVQFTPRPDFILNAPSFLTHSKGVWQEVTH